MLHDNQLSDLPMSLKISSSHTKSYAQGKMAHFRLSQVDHLQNHLRSHNEDNLSDNFYIWDKIKGAKIRGSQIYRQVKFKISNFGFE